MALDDKLDIVKPKRLYDDKNIVFSDDVAYLLFDSTIVSIKLDKKFHGFECSIKDAFSDEFPTDTKEVEITSITPNFTEEIVFNANNSKFFSIVSGIGEDNFVSGRFRILDNKIELSVLGLNYFCIYEIPYTGSVNLDIFVNWNMFYYLFKLFGKLTGKKIDKLLLDVSKDKIIHLSDSGKTFIITVDKFSVNEIYNKIVSRILSDKYEDEKEILKTEFNQSTTVEKQFLRMFDDVVRVSENLTINKYACQDFSCYILKSRS